MREKKVDDLMGVVRDCLLKRRYAFKKHARIRMEEREILHKDLITVMANGKWLKRRDRYDALEGWSYYIYGHTLDGRDLGVVVALVDDPVMTLVVTIIDLKGATP